MNDKGISIRFVLLLNLILVASLFLSACGAGQIFGPSPTPTPTATSTSTPTDTPTPTVTPTGTPAPLGKTAFNDTWEVIVLGVVARNSIKLRENSQYQTKPGSMIVDVGVKVRYLSKTNVSIDYKDIVVIVGNGDRAGLSWSGVEYNVGDKEVDPFSLSISDFPTKVEGVTYFRLIFIIPKVLEQTVIFRFQNNAPLVAFTVKAR